MQQDRRRQRGRETPINKRAYKTVAIINILIPISEGRQQILYHKHYWVVVPFAAQQDRRHETIANGSDGKAEHNDIRYNANSAANSDAKSDANSVYEAVLSLNVLLCHHLLQDKK